MFDSKKAASSDIFEGDVTVVLGEGAEFEGKLLLEGIARIDGHFRGDIFSRDTVVIGENGKVWANIDADVVVVAGFLEGKVTAQSKIEIQSSGHLKGQVLSPVFKIEEGAVFDGVTRMLDNENSSSTDSPQP